VQVDALLLYMVATAPGAFTVNVCESRMTASGPVTYTGNTFEVTVKSDRSGGTSILRGTFNSDRTASGRLDAFTVPRGCLGESPILLGEQDAENWTGSKQ
jgi:hypothetical protein